MVTYYWGSNLSARGKPWTERGKTPFCVKEWDPNLNYLLKTSSQETEVKHDLKPVKLTGTSEGKWETTPCRCLHDPVNALKLLKMLELCLQLPGGDCERLLWINLFKRKI